MKVAVTKDFDGSLGGRAVTIDVNFTRLIIDDIVKSPEGHSRLANTLSLYEKIRINEILQSATYEDRYKILPGEVLTNRWIGKFAKMVPEERNFLKAVIERKSRGEGKDSTTFLLVGNSHADIISRELQDEFKQNYSFFHMFTAPGCVPFYVPEHLSFVTPDHQMPIKACSTYSQLVREAIQTIQPDYLFIAFRWYGSFEDQPFNDSNNDEILGLINSFLLEIQKNVKIQIFFPAPNLLFKYETSRELAKRLWRGAQLEQLHISYKEHLKKNNWSYQRLQHLNCQKCLVYDLSTHFCNSTNDRCAAFDETTKLAIFFDTNHLSYLGRQLARPFLRSLLTPL
uniref:SGNH domain-containing protein n=1 Tax=Meloidogyne incognita TaxID=6306 RepID=A0A914KGJ9_MELIC